MDRIKGLLTYVKLLPIAFFGALCTSFAASSFTPIQDPANPDPNAAVPYFTVGAILGFLVFLALAWFLERMSGQDGVQAVYAAFNERLRAKGFASANVSAVASGKGKEATLDLADRLISQAYADRKEVLKFKDALGKYTDSSLVQKLNLESSFSNVQTKKTNMAVMFTDIRGFTKMSEILPVEDVVRILNDYFAIAANAVHGNNGRINKFIGDAVMAVFEDPQGYMTGSQACRNAIQAGLQLVRDFRRQVRIWHEKVPQNFEADLGAGIHYGYLIFGNMGSPERMEYTAIGDTVNFASRLCSKAAGGQVRISEESFKLVDGYFLMTPDTPISVKGKTGEYKTWLVDGVKGS